MSTLTSGRLRFGSVVLLVSSLLFAAFPLIRPFFPYAPETAEELAQVAAGLTDPLWVVSHLLAAVALSLLVFVMLTMYALFAGTRSEGKSFVAAILGVTGIALLLVVIGAETFGLSAVAEAYVRGQATDLDALTKLVRTPVQFALLLPGLISLAASAITFVVVNGKERVLARWGLVVYAIGLTLWLPIMPEMVRLIDGLLIGVGGVWLSAACWRLAAART